MSNGKSWERVKGTPGVTHPSPILAAYIDRITERVNQMVQKPIGRRLARRQIRKAEGR